MQRTRRIHAGIALTATLVILIGSTSSATVNPPPPTPPPALVAVKSVGDKFALGDPSYIKGHDRGQSVRYTSGSTDVDVWSFGDTGTHSTAHDDLISNSVAATNDFDLDDNITTWIYDNMVTPSPTSTVPNPTQVPIEAVDLPAPYPSRNVTLNCDTCYKNWGGMMVADPANHRIVMMYHIIGRNVKPPYPSLPKTDQHYHDADVVDKGYGIAIRDMSVPGSKFVPQQISNASLSTNPYLLWYNPSTDPQNTTGFPAFASGLVRGDDDYFYGYSCAGGFAAGCTIARVGAVNAGSIYNRNSWRYWSDGNSPAAAPTSDPNVLVGCPVVPGWTTEIGCASTVRSGDAGGSLTGGAGGMSVFKDPALNKWVQVYAAGAQIRYRVADQLEGPWSRSDVIAQMKDGNAYAAYAHPEFSKDGGLTQYITYYHVLSAEEIPAGSSKVAELRVVKAALASDDDALYRTTSAETYFGQDTPYSPTATLRINSKGFTDINHVAGIQGVGPYEDGPAYSATTAAWDRNGVIYSPDAVNGPNKVTVQVRLQGQTATGTGADAALSGLVIRNDLTGAHNHYDGPPGRGYVVLAQRAGGGLVLRADLDGDHDLDGTSGASVASSTAVNGVVWLRLERTGSTYVASWAPDVSGAAGTFSPFGSVTLTNAADPQDAGMFTSSKASGDEFNKGTFSGFSVS